MTKNEAALDPHTDPVPLNIMSSTASGPTECCICFEAFNKSRRKMVRCAYCSIDDIAFCRTCVETYLIQDDAQEPRCPNPSCRIGWSEDFLSDNLTATFLTGPYKRHRERILLDREKARLPETQTEAQRYRRARDLLRTDYLPTLDRLAAEIEALPEVIAEKESQTTYMNLQKKFHSYSHPEVRAAFNIYCEKERIAFSVRRPIRNQIRAITSTEAYKEASQLVANFGALHETAARPSRPTNQWTFIMKCAVPSCEGFVGMNWVCGLCEMKHCKDCREPLIASGTDTEHICNEEKRQTVAAIAKEAKPCPKCAAMISKIDGCDQMWCTQCRTAFSWRTGAVESSHVHNPHYFEWMRRNGGQAELARQAQQARQPLPECVGPLEIIDAVHYQFIRNRQIGDWVRTLRHYYYDLRQIEATARGKAADEWKRRLRVQRLVGDLEDDAWKVKLQRGEKSAHKNRRHAQVLQTFIHAGADILRGVMDGTATPPAVHEQMQQLMQYCNEQLAVIRARYKNQVDALVFLDSTPAPLLTPVDPTTIPNGP